MKIFAVPFTDILFLEDELGNPCFSLANFFRDILEHTIFVDVHDIRSNKDLGRWSFHGDEFNAEAFFKKYDEYKKAEENRKSLWNQC